ncbi:MAG: radical SAM protein [archaeon]
MAKLKLKLIQVANYRELKWMVFPTLGLPMIAAVTPANYDVQIVDERAEPLNLNDNPDIVGVSFECFRQKRAFEIAESYRKKKIKVIFGGMHTTSCYNEVLKHCDAAVVGEAEELWPKVISDFEKKTLKKIYRQDKPVDLSNLPLPRLDLINLNNYTIVSTIQATRGCIHNCQFCFSKTINPTYRAFPVDYVYEQCKRAKHHVLGFMDDNFTADRKNAIKVLNRIAPLKKNIGFQANLYIGRDIELLKVMKKAGVVGIFAGMESINEESLKSVSKGFNKIKDYELCIRNLKEYGIEPKLGVIFGFDHDTKAIFKDTLDFINRNNVLHVAANLIIPYPGSDCYDFYQKQNRILHNNFHLYDGRNVIVKPKHMTPKELEDGYKWFRNNYHAPLPTFKRMATNIKRPKNVGMHFAEFIAFHALKLKSSMTGKKFRN